MKKILILLLFSLATLLVGCEQITDNTQRGLCDRAQVCLHLFSGGEVVRSVKDPQVQATSPGVMAFIINNENVFWSGDYLFIQRQ